MKLTDELFEKGKHQDCICTIIDDDYVLLKKTMPCTDDYLNTYISNINKAKESGINIAGIVDYKFIDGTTETYGESGNTRSYTTGVFIEDRAKGSLCPEFKKEIQSSDDLKEYINTCNQYLIELEKRANADQKIFDKLVLDYYNIYKFDLCVDPKPLNFYFDEKKGFTIIDVIDVPFRTNEFFASHICGAVFGYGVPHSYQLGEYTSVLSQSQFNKYNELYEVIISKIEQAILNLNLVDEYTYKDLEQSKQLFSIKNKYTNVIPDDQLEDYINSFHQQR